MDRKKNAEHHNHNADKYLEDTSAGYVVSASSGLYEPKPPNRQSAHEYPNQKVERPKAIKADIFSNVIGVLGVIISTLTLVGLFLTVRVANRQWSEAHRTANASITAAEASKESADAAQKANNQAAEATKDATKTQIQIGMPFVFVVNATPSESEGDPTEYVVHQEWGNKGETRADGVIINWSIARNSAGTDHAFRGKVNLSKSTMTKDVNYTDELNIPKAELDRLRDNATVLYDTGRITYRDVFGLTNKHLVEYCTEITKLVTRNGNLSWHVNACKDYRRNCYDKACADHQKYLSKP